MHRAWPGDGWWASWDLTAKNWSVGDTAGSVCYRLPNQAEQVDKGFYRKQPCVTRPCPSWGASTTLAAAGWLTQHRVSSPEASKRALDDNSPIKAAEETRRGALLELNHTQGITDWGCEGKRQPHLAHSECLNFFRKMEYILQKFQSQRGRRSKEHLILW